MNTETIFSSYKPIEQYLELLQTARGIVPSVLIRGIDAFLMRQIVLCYPSAPTVVDLAGAATVGASTVFWAWMAGSMQMAVGMQPAWDVNVVEGWPSLASDGSSAQNIHPLPFIGSESLEMPGEWAITKAELSINSLSPLFFTLAQTDGTPAEIQKRIECLLNLERNAVILLFPIGTTGESAALEAALNVCRIGSDYRLSLMREVSPFFATSQLAVISRRDNQHIPSILDRIRALYDGNFNYLALAEENIKLHLQSAKIQSVAITQVTPDAERQPDGSVAVPPLSQRLLKRAKTFIRKLTGGQVIEHRLHYVKALLPNQMQIGETYECSIRVRNDDPKPWYTPEQSKNCINIAYHWKSEKGEMLVKEGQRSPLLAAVFPGETATLPFKVTMPGQPGKYQLEVDFVHEGVAWFSDTGAPGPTFAVEVLP